MQIIKRIMDTQHTTTVWEKVKILSGSFAAVLIPVIVAYIGYTYTQTIKEREIQGRFVELAVDILRDEPKPENKSLRDWGTQIINKYSGIQLTKELKNDLIDRTSFPSERTKYARKLVIKNVPDDSVGEINSLLLDAGALEVRIHKEKGKDTEITAIIGEDYVESVSKEISEILKKYRPSKKD